jgi:hypothetical protein
MDHCTGYSWFICDPLEDIAHPIQVEELRQIKDAPAHHQAKITQALHLVYAMSQEHCGNQAAAGLAGNTRYQRYKHLLPLKWSFAHPASSCQEERREGSVTVSSEGFEICNLAT